MVSKFLKVLFPCVLAMFFVTSCCNCDKEGCKCQCKDKKECVKSDDQCPSKCDGPMMRPGCPDGPQEVMCPKKKERCDKWMKFDSLSADEQKALLQEMKSDIDKREAEMAAKKAEMEQKWANFESLSIEEQKMLIGMKMGGPRMCPMQGKFAPHHGDREGRHGHHGHRGEK